jgi:hypothetical protein
VAVGDDHKGSIDNLFVVDSDTGKAHHLMRNQGKWMFTGVTQSVGVDGGNDALSTTVTM